MVKIVALSAANIRHQPQGTSYRLARQTLDHLLEMRPDAETSLVTLVDKRIEPCIGCGQCARTHQCQAFGDDFDAIYSEIVKSDALIIVAAHYAPIPAKLCAFFERIESISFLGQHNNPGFSFPLADKPYAVIGHAGGTSDIWHSYHDVIFAPIKNALAFPVSMKPVDTGTWPHIGVMLGPSEVASDAESVFPRQIYDDDLLRAETLRVAKALLERL